MNTRSVLLHIVMSTVCPAGTCETAIHFMIYEHIKKLVKCKHEELSLVDCMCAAGVAKFTASTMCYPHGKLVAFTVYSLSIQTV